MILDGIMISAATERWKEIEQTFRGCADCQKTILGPGWMDVTPCTEHKPLVKELQQLAEKAK